MPTDDIDTTVSLADAIVQLTHANQVSTTHALAIALGRLCAEHGVDVEQACALARLSYEESLP